MTINSIGGMWTTGATAGTGKRAAQYSGDSIGPAIDSAAFILPTKENAQKVTSALSTSLKSAFQQAGIATTPPVDLSVDPSDGHIHVTGNRSDTKQIEAMINGNADLAKQTRDAQAINDQAAGVERSLQFETEYMASSDPQAVVSKYSSLFGSRAASSCTLRFTGSGVQTIG